MRQSHDHLVQKNACELLVQIDPSSINLILDDLNRKRYEAKTTIGIIRILGEIRSDEWIQAFVNTLKAYLNDKNPHLRAEALAVYYNIIGDEGERLYLEFINDTDVGVQKRAIQCLSSIKSETALEKFLAMLKEAEDFPSEKTQQIEPGLFSALGSYGNVELPGIGSIEDYLLKTLDRRLNLGPLKFLKKKKNPLNERITLSVCETLSKIGTSKSLPILRKLEKQDGKQWNHKIEEALMKIAEREGEGSGSN